MDAQSDRFYPKILSKTSLKQMIYGIWINLTIVSIGLSYEIASGAVTNTQALSNANEQEKTFYGNIITLSAPVGCIVSGIVIDWFGRKPAMLICEVPLVIGWTYIALARTQEDMLFSRCITGIGIGMAIPAPRVYASEMTLPNIRDIIGGFPNIALLTGVGIQALLGTMINWRIRCYLCACYVLAVFALNFFLPETPFYLIMVDREEDAKTSLARFRDKSYDVNREMEEMLDFKVDNNIRRLRFTEHLVAVFTHSSCKPLGVIVIYILITKISGLYIVSYWAKDIMIKSNSNVDPDIEFTLLTATRFFGSILCSLLFLVTDKKTLSVVSGLGAGIAFLVLGSYVVKNEKGSVYPLVILCAYVLFASIGYYTIPLLMMSEVFPLQVRGLMCGITVAFIYLVILCSVNVYPFLECMMDFNFVISFMGICSILGCFYFFFYMPETNDKSLQDIEEYFNQKRASLVSEKRVRSIQLMEAERSRQSQTLVNNQDRRRSSPAIVNKPLLLRDQSRNNITPET